MRSIFLALGLLLFAGRAAAETVVFASGEIMIGRVLSMSDTSIRLRVGFPKDETVEVPRDSIAPESLYSILEGQSDPDSATDRVKLAEESRKLGLLGHAIAEYREALRLDSSLEERVTKEIASLRSMIAADLLTMIEKSIENQQPVAARLNLEVLVERYADTPSGRKGASILPELEKKMHMASEGIEADAKEVAAALKKATRLEANATRARKGAEGPIIRSASTRRKREKALGYLEQAWEEIGGLAAPKSRDFVGDFTGTKARIRETLEKEYLVLGTYHVGRLSLPRAEDYNVKACKLGAEHSTCKRLQEIIVRARISGNGL